MKYDIYLRSPINRISGVVTSQKNVTDDSDLDRTGLIECLKLLERKHNLLKKVLNVKNRRNHQNLMYRFNNRRRKATGHKQPRVLLEYVRIGKEMQKFINEIRKVKYG